MADIEKNLIDEITRWRKRLAEKRKTVVLIDKTKEDFIQNIDSYIDDSTYFFNRKDYIRAFESLIWSWAWIEIGERLEILKSK